MLLIIFLVSSILTALVRFYSLNHQVMDIPNNRSSHTVPTPRGGGVSFALVFILYLFYLGITKKITKSEDLSFLVASITVAAFGFLDDHCSIPAKWRLLIHFFAASTALYYLNGMVSFIPFDLYIFSGSFLTNTFALFFLVWLLNLYNFMDGINGLAAVEAITVCLGGALIYSLSGLDSLAILPLSLAVAVAGFLFWNFPVAKIFMGDVGSGFLGIVIGIFTIQAANTRTEFFWSWMILLGIFIVDATIALFRRLINGENVFQAHRSHAYQRAADRYQSHTKVTIVGLLINLFWLLPLAILVGFGRLRGLTGIIVAYLPLIALATYFQGISYKGLKLFTKIT